MLFEKKVLRTAVSHVKETVAKRSTIPVLSNLLLRRDDGEDGTKRVELVSTNLETATRVWLTPKDVGDWADGVGITVSAGQLYALLGAPGDDARLELGYPESEAEDPAPDRLRVYVGNRATAELRGIDAKEFPLIPTFDDEESHVELPGNALLEAAARTFHAAATDEKRPVLTGLLFELSGDGLALTAADGFRLARVQANVEVGGMTGTEDEGETAIVPRRTVEILPKVLEGSETIKVSIPERRNQMIFSGDGAEVVTQLVEGNFPDWTMIVRDSKESTTWVDLATDGLAQALFFGRPLSRDAADTVNMDVDIENLSVTAKTNETELGFASMPVPAQAGGGEGMRVACNEKYMSQALSACPTESARIEFRTWRDPIVLRQIDGDGAGPVRWLEVIMPMAPEGRRDE